MTDSGYVPHLYSVSIKGVVVREGRVLLVKTDRGEWELPGGRIEPGETPEDCVAREVAEETRWPVTTGPILDARLHYMTVTGKYVFIVTYGCYPDTDAAPVRSDEHEEIGLFAEDEIAALNLPEGYKRSIATWFTRLRAAETSRN
ncbi:NUDIX domain-containing protein [Nocardia sp. CDC159]|uniref:NUDIX domain-containing protein n=1 Tax=Nocardia pulmonis TaxID=2951408 RepID=A0A9X2E547_9NOCA|nr:MULTISPECIES: NUDIX domain-containing protein [Nocardia]MCM6774477.1 NUDIX domain-containing protein [Nocardia pulmonis]MCM6787457.1 NUDIX domain-containing protein [Nocardia sp. CDC159]